MGTLGSSVCPQSGGVSHRVLQTTQGLRVWGGGRGSKACEDKERLNDPWTGESAWEPGVPEIQVLLNGGWHSVLGFLWGAAESTCLCSWVSSSCELVLAHPPRSTLTVQVPEGSGDPCFSVGTLGSREQGTPSDPAQPCG